MNHACFWYCTCRSLWFIMVALVRTADYLDKNGRTVLVMRPGFQFISASSPILQVVKPFLEHKTYKKVKFVYSDNTESQKIMTDLFEMDKLESAFRGHNPAGFDLNKYAEKMKEDDQKMSAFIESASSVFFQDQSHVSVLQPEFSVTEHQLESSSDSSPSSDVESPRTADTKILSANEMKEQLNCKNTTIAESGVSCPLIHMNDFA
ncbi:hypothetical protein B296_00032442 [Ensete ventricosum]|uniref:CRAL-TRIO domain-containing protein n=1 Tax=Ensete ventricosum TaxID=4639 RepID=A0A426ZH87_ENSVE|nr:hypothetical protein B296_00032442 [Ensete ventricosum]